MSVSDDVPVNVPAGATAPAKRKRLRVSGKGNDDSVPFLTRSGDGWRFQLRVPAALAGDFQLAGRGNIVRRTLGPRGRGDAKRLARQLATLCESIFALAAAQKDANAMDPLSPPERNLAQQVVDACQAAIGRALKQPAQAVGLARGLNGALTSLLLVQSEVAKGESGARAVVHNADALARQALADVLKMSAQPAEALAALAAVPNVAPPAPPPPAPPPAPPSAPSAGVRTLPTFGEISQRYIDMRVRNNAKDSEIQRLRFARRSFIEICGDRPIDQYFPSDLQEYVTSMQHYPANASKRKALQGLSVREILEANKKFTYKPLARKTLKDGLVAAIRTEARAGMADHRYRDPFAGVEIRWPDMLVAPVPREGIGVDVVNRVFRDGVSSGLLDEAMLPPLAKLSARRGGLLTNLRGSDIREKYGVMIAQVSGIVFVGNKWQRVPIKTGESAGFFVLHNFLREIGFTDWARGQGDNWIFAAAHEHPDPAKYMSKTMRRLLRRNGAQAGEVFHSLRGDGIDAMRGAKVDARTRRLQAGHQLGDEHDQYGHRALSAEECQRLANLPLPKGIDWTVFKGLDFDRLALTTGENCMLVSGGVFAVIISPTFTF